MKPGSVVTEHPHARLRPVNLLMAENRMAQYQPIYSELHGYRLLLAEHHRSRLHATARTVSENPAWQRGE